MFTVCRAAYTLVRLLLDQLSEAPSQPVQKLRPVFAWALTPFCFDKAVKSAQERIDRKVDGSLLAKLWLGILACQCDLESLLRRELTGRDFQKKVWSEAREAIDTLHRRAGHPDLRTDDVGGFSLTVLGS